MSYAPFRKILRFLPMPVIAVITGLISGGVAWQILDYFQTKAVRNLVEEELASQVDLQARESLLRFDTYIQSYSTLGKLLANHRNLANYLEPIYWQADDPLLVKISKKNPDWLPNTPQWQHLSRPSHVLLVDLRGQLRESYQISPLDLPMDLRLNGRQLFPRLQTTTYITMFDGKPYLLVSEPAEDTGYNVMGTLVLLTPINELFMQKSQVLSENGHLIALLDDDGQKVIISNHQSSLPQGKISAKIEDHYVMRIQSFIDYGGSDINLFFASLLPKANVQSTIDRMLNLERKQRLYGVLFIIFIFTLLFMLVSIRLSKTLRRISHFSQLALGIQQQQPRKGNQLLILDHWVKDFINQVKQMRDEIDARYAIEIHNKELLRSTIMDVSPDAIITIDDSHGIIDTNLISEQLFLYSSADLIGSNAITLLFNTQKLAVYQLLRHSESPQDAIRLNAQTRDKKNIPVELSIKLLRLNDRILYTLYIRDISLRLKQEQEIRSMAAFASESPIPVMRINQQGMIIYANEASKQILSYWQTSVMQDLPPFWLDLALKSLKVQHLIESELDIESHIFSLVLAPILEFNYINIFARDVTDARQAQAQAQQHHAELVHVARLSTMGEMAAGMAHELNQPLSVIANYANGSLQRIKNADHELIYPLKNIAAQAQRAGDIIKGIRALVNKQESVRKVVNLNDLLNEVLLFIAQPLKLAQIDLEITLKKDLFITVNPVQIEQVILNLYRNAMDAIAEHAAPKMTIKSFKINNQAIFEIEDNGKGMSDNEIAQLFHPFFTTKKQGMGMGLAISKTILEDHQGTIIVQSYLHQGAKFTVSLPLNEK